MTQEFLPKQDSVFDEDVDDAQLEPGAIVKLTQRVRLRALNELTDNGREVTKNLGDTMQLLRDLDQAALTTRKLNIEEKSSDDGRAARESFDKLVGMLGDRSPYEAPKEVGNESAPPPPRTRSPLPQNHVKRPVSLNQGEDAQGEQVLSISNYISVEE